MKGILDKAGRNGLLLALLALGLPAGAASPAPAPGDPWEGANRRIFAFNDYLDDKLLKPVARGYRAVAPGFVDTGVSNVFDNLGEVPSLLNHLLQGRFANAGANTERLFVNSTLGLLGLFDVASKLGIERHDTDTGVTLGRWGMGPGPYIVLPLFGPSSLRDGTGRGVDVLLHPMFYLEDERLGLSLRAIDIVDTRADLLEVEELITGDRYTFLRNLYLQRRQFLIGGDTALDDFGDEEFEEFEDP